MLRASVIHKGKEVEITPALAIYLISEIKKSPFYRRDYETLYTTFGMRGYHGRFQKYFISVYVETVPEL